MVTLQNRNQTKSDLVSIWKQYRKFVVEAKLRNEVEQVVYFERAANYIEDKLTRAGVI